MDSCVPSRDSDSLVQSNPGRVLSRFLFNFFSGFSLFLCVSFFSYLSTKKEPAWPVPKEYGQKAESIKLLDAESFCRFSG